MPGFLYFGRLEKEKGFDAILGMLRKFLNKGELPFSIFIFGSGIYEKELLELAQKSKNIHFFGWRSLSEIKRYIVNCQYCLMPSTFLETFGLTALTAISRGLPVIGYKKGGLVPFIEKTNNLEGFPGLCTDEKLFNCIGSILKQKSHNYKPSIELKSYSKETRLGKVKPLIGSHKKILLVSDFTNKIGGIETYMHDVKDLLKKDGYKIEIWGSYLPKGSLGSIKKLFGIGLGLFNIFGAIRLWKYCKKEKPDLIRYHSTLRRYGWMTVLVGRICSKETWVMYHDFGYFFPFPKKLLYKQQIKTPLTLFSFLSMAKSKSLIRRLLVTGKFMNLFLLKKQFKKVNRHIVPSDFLIDILHKSHNVPKKKIVCLEHFLQQ